MIKNAFYAILFSFLLIHISVYATAKISPVEYDQLIINDKQLLVDGSLEKVNKTFAGKKIAYLTNVSDVQTSFHGTSYVVLQAETPCFFGYFTKHRIKPIEFRGKRLKATFYAKGIGRCDLIFMISDKKEKLLEPSKKRLYKRGAMFDINSTEQWRKCEFEFVIPKEFTVKEGQSGKVGFSSLVFRVKGKVAIDAVSLIEVNKSNGKQGGINVRNMKSRS